MSKFMKGQSGNPKGRPAGVPSPTARLRIILADDLPGILAALVAKAKDGDVGAANLILSRCIPPLRPQSEADEIPISGTTLAERAEAVSAAAMNGELPPSTANELMGMLGLHARIIEVATLEQRITALENQDEQKT